MCERCLIRLHRNTIAQTESFLLGSIKGGGERPFASLEKAQGDVLDLCAGTLDMTQMLVAQGAKSVVAADFSEKMLSAGQSNWKRRPCSRACGGCTRSAS